MLWFPVQNVSYLRSLCGHLSFYRKFILILSSIVRLLTNLFNTYIFLIFFKTNNSDWVIGEVLSGLKLPVSFFSRKLKNNNCRYSTFEKECLAIVLAVIRFQLYQNGLISEFRLKPIISGWCILTGQRLPKL